MHKRKKVKWDEFSKVEITTCDFSQVSNSCFLVSPMHIIIIMLFGHFYRSRWRWWWSWQDAKWTKTLIMKSLFFWRKLHAKCTIRAKRHCTWEIKHKIPGKTCHYKTSNKSILNWIRQIPFLSISQNQFPRNCLNL